MRTAEDTLRSLKRYTAEVLGEAWEVRLPDDDAAFERPFARVEAAGPMNALGGSRWIAEAVRPYAIVAYPEVGSTVGETALIAARVEDQLYHAFRAGVGLGRPLRVPLYDYTGVPDDEGSVARHPSDFMRVTDLSVNTVTDPDAPEYSAVVADVRLSWARPAGTLPAGRVVETVTYGSV
jgi:hypothetical protein